jgi:RNA polymerase sigma-B factor
VSSGSPPGRSSFPRPRISAEQRDEKAHALLVQAAAASDPVTRAELLEQVVVLHLDVAESVAARYRNRGLNEEDLRQAACEGLVKAAQRFDPALRHDFLSYAVPTMRGEVQRHFRDHGWAVRPPRRLQELQWQLNRTRDDLTAMLGREPTEEELLESLEVSAQELSDAEQAHGSFRLTSLDQPVGSGETGTLGDLVIDDRGDDLRAAEARLVLRPLVSRLSERDRQILRLRFFEDRTQQQIGDEFGISQMQVSRHLSRIMTTLRDALGSLEVMQASA